MPKTLYISEFDCEGVDITYYKTKRELTIGGWYDSIVGIPCRRMPLREFFDELGITEKDCLKVFEEG